MTRNVLGGILALSTLTASATADVEVVAIDFGMAPAPSCGETPLYSGSFDGSDGFVAMNLEDCGTVENPSIDIGGGVTLAFVNVGGWNNTDGVGPDELQALTGDHFFSSANGADDPVGFSVTGLDPDDILILEFLDRRGSESALVTFEGVTTLVSSDELGRFTDVSGGGVTGKTAYEGTFTGAEGAGEGNLAGARVSVIRTDAAPCEGDFDGDGIVGGGDFGLLLVAWGPCAGCPEDLDGNGTVGGSDVGLLLVNWGECEGGGGPLGACCLGENCLEIGEADCAALGGQYLGDGSNCKKADCTEPTKGSCCETGLVPGCIDASCSNAVCLVLPDCCDVLWDANCATLALDVCNDCDGTTDFNSYAIDFGMAPAPSCGPSPVFSGTYDGSSNFIGMSLTDCGVVESPSLDVGEGLTLSFVNVNGWNNTDGFPANEVPALTGDHFFSSSLGADDPVAFSVSGLEADDLLVLEFLDRRGAETALVTFNGTTTLVSNEEFGRFTDVSGGGVTGSTSYDGSFTNATGIGEGNLAGARINVVRSNPDVVGACCLGEACWQIGEMACEAIGGTYLGDGVACEAGSCEAPGVGPCCEPGTLPSCEDLTCAYVVCLTLPQCCDVLWDADCAALAVTECNDCDGTTDVQVAAIDFGMAPAPSCGESPLFTGAFDGIDGFVALNLEDCGTVESPSIDIGDGVTLEFVNVGGWNNTDGVPATATQALTGDHFFSAANGAEDPVTFRVSGVDPCSTLILEFLDRRGSEAALVTFAGVTTLVDAVPETGGEFTDVSGGGVIGQSTYTGTFTGAAGSGEGNLAGARITIIPGEPGCEFDPCVDDIGDCAEVQDNPGCECSDCEQIVCDIDPICCELIWDSVCVQLAENNCNP